MTIRLQPRTRTQPSRHGVRTAGAEARHRAGIYHQRMTGRDVAIKWESVNRARRNPCRKDLAAWLKTYKSAACSAPWSTAHLAAIERLQYAILHGGQFALAMPRGDGKSTLCRGAAEWAVLEGHRKYVVVIGATDRAARQLLRQIKVTFQELPEILDDYPEIACFRVDNLAYRVRSQLHDGAPTRCAWTHERVVMPAIDAREYASNGAILDVTSMSGNIRGRSHTLADGTVARPDLVILDDPQTEESARSILQTDALENVINKDVLNLGGSDKAIAAVMPCTVIYPHDLAERFLDREKRPQWAGERTRLVEAWPDNMRPWEQYHAARMAGIANMDGGAAANAFYEAHRTELEAGAVVTWPERVPDGRLSRLQFAMEKYFDIGEDAFASEYQNEPIRRDSGILRLMPERVLRQQHRLPRGVMPAAAAYLTVGVDINMEGLNWLVLATANDMTGWIVDYGLYPGGGKALFTLGAGGDDYQLAHTAIAAALHAFMPRLFAQQYTRENGGPVRIEQVGIDCAGWTGVPVMRFCETAIFGGDILPARGFAASGRVHYATPTGRRLIWRGDYCDVRRDNSGGNVLSFQADWWRKHAQDALQVPVGAPCAISLYRDKPTAHKRISEHLCSRYLAVYAPEIEHYQWENATPHDHLLDALEMALVCAARRGARIGGGGKTRAEKRRDAPEKKARVVYSDVKPGQWR